MFSSFFVRNSLQVLFKMTKFRFRVVRLTESETAKQRDCETARQRGSEAARERESERARERESERARERESESAKFPSTCVEQQVSSEFFVIVNFGRAWAGNGC